ncbi:uncharacterized protein LOC113685055 isoform X2 [Pocillopora damicornis]|uniref:uncharacterized protein LOC113685055 isoform X2 n=1 Tax=Pocillopora damicornis TaxID=46731 RepID=UPI000F553681|nr:uncharacterized protein LOC113685055 isoform X2 [Pocillopora damicornis]
MQMPESCKGSWPLDSSCLVYNLEILKACRHHFAHIGGSLPEDSLCFLSSEVSHLCPGPFVQIQLVVALRTGNNELLDCHLVADETGQFKVNGGRGVIEAEVKPVGCKHLVETLSIDCGGKELPSCTGNFLFLLPVSSSAYQVNIRFRALTGELLDEISKPILTHHQGTNLFDYCDGHSLPSVEFPISKKQPVGAIECFRRDILRLMQHINSSNHVEAKYQDLLLAVKLEKCLILYQMGDFEGCKHAGEEVCIQANRNHSTNYNALVGRAKSVISGAYRTEGDFEKAGELLDSSTELLQAVVPNEETSINHTRVAALLCEKAAVMGITKSERKKLKKALKDVILRPRHRSERNQSRNARSRRRALIRAILFYLCSRKGKATNLQTDVSQKDLARAEEFAQKFKRDYLTNCPMRDRAGFYSAYGDLLTRKGQYEEGLYSFNVCILEVHNMILIQW